MKKPTATPGPPAKGEDLRRPAGRAVERAVRAGAQSYRRERDLPGLIRLDPLARIPDTAEAIAAIVARLERALRAERNRARSGHWTYDLNRHIALRQAYVAETEQLRAIKAKRSSGPMTPR